MYEALYAPIPDAEAYARRIGAPWPITPDLPTLDQILYAHQRNVPFENLESYAKGVVPSLEIPALFDKLVTRRRGGYCFEVNALMNQVNGAIMTEITGEPPASGCTHKTARCSTTIALW